MRIMHSEQCKYKNRANPSKIKSGWSAASLRAADWDRAYPARRALSLPSPTEEDFAIMWLHFTATSAFRQGRRSLLTVPAMELRSRLKISWDVISIKHPLSLAISSKLAVNCVRVSLFHSDRQLTGEGLSQPELLSLYLIIPCRIFSP